MSVRIKCIIREEFRKDFEAVALHGAWHTSSHPALKEFSMDKDASAIPTNHCSFPTKWDGCDEKGEEYETSWDKESGEWIFACSINRICCSVLRDFDEDIIPLIVERFIKYETWIEPIGDSDTDESVDITDTMNKWLADCRKDGR